MWTTRQPEQPPTIPPTNKQPIKDDVNNQTVARQAESNKQTSPHRWGAKREFRKKNRNRSEARKRTTKSKRAKVQESADTRNRRTESEDEEQKPGEPKNQQEEPPNSHSRIVKCRGEGRSNNNAFQKQPTTNTSQTQNEATRSPQLAIRLGSGKRPKPDFFGKNVMVGSVERGLKAEPQEKTETPEHHNEGNGQKTGTRNFIVK